MNLVPPKPMTISASIVAIVGSFAGGAAAQSDNTRYAKMRKLPGLERFSDISLPTPL